MARLSFIMTISAIALACVLAEEELYSNRYDDLDIEKVLTNDKQRNQYYNCFMDIAPCKTADAKFFKDILGESMQTQCRKCTEKQKNLLNLMVDWYTRNESEKWEALVRKIIGDAQKKNG